MRTGIHLRIGVPHDRGVGGHRSRLQVFGHLAAGHQHGHNFLMVFLIQNTQNRDSAALHLKLDELIRVSESARNKLLDLEGLSEAELEHLKGSFTRLADAPDTALLHKAAEDLDVAGAEIQEAKEKVSAAADAKARKPLS